MLHMNDNSVEKRCVIFMNGVSERIRKVKVLVNFRFMS